MYTLDIKQVREHARGNWQRILISQGFDGRFLKNKNGPCPFCGGVDRWRWDNKSGDGGGYCHQCDAQGDGFKLLGKWLNLTSRQDLPKLLKVVADTLSSGPVLPVLQSKTPDLQKRINNHKAAEQIWNGSYGLSEDSLAYTYLQKRGLRGPFHLECLRYHPSLPYGHGEQFFGFFPALISKVTNLQGELLAVHRIFLSDKGGKANVPAVKKILGSFGGGAIKFDAATEILNIAEGVETALAVREMTKGPVWSAISAGNLGKIEVPPTVRKVTIWADLDPSMTGEREANVLANRLYHQGIDVIVKMPKPLPGLSQDKIDWLDFYSFQNKKGDFHV